MPEKTTNIKSNQRNKIAAVLKALSNENRLAIFEQLRSGHVKGQFDSGNRLSICEVASNFNIALSTISHHIKELRSAGLVKCERKGQTIH